MRVQLLTSANAGAFWHLRLEALETEPQAFGASAEEHRATTVEQIAERLAIAPDGSFVMGAFDGGELVGVSGLAREARPKTRHKAFVWGVYVNPSHRDNGVGRALMNAVLDRVRGYADLRQINIRVAVTQSAATRLYESLGF